MTMTWPNNKIASPEPPSPVSISTVLVHRTLDSLPAPDSGGGRSVLSWLWPHYAHGDYSAHLAVEDTALRVLFRSGVSVR